MRGVSSEFGNKHGDTDFNYIFVGYFFCRNFTQREGWRVPTEEVTSQYCF